MSSPKIYQIITEAIRRKASEVLPPGSKVVLFGSRARKDARPDSDWDLHILVPGPERLPFATARRFGSPFEELGWDLGEEINTVVHSFSGWSKRSFLPLYQNIQHDGIEL